MPSAVKSEVKSASKCENINDPIDTHFIEYIAMMFSRLFIKLHIIPNVVTVLSAVVGVAGGILLCLDLPVPDIIGALLIILAAVFDASDGQVARLTKHYSNFGRTLDGFADFLVYFSIYIAICVRLYEKNIPFTETAWGIWIIPVALTALLLFGAQARAADYFKNLHIFMVTRGQGGELSRTAGIKKQIAESERFSFERLRLSIYHTYTGLQEKKTPKTQKLLEEIENNGGDMPDALCDAFINKSRKYVMSTNLLTFNLRTVVLFILLFLPGNAEFLYFPFVIFILEPVRAVIIAKYERLASDLTKQKFFTDTESKV